MGNIQMGPPKGMTLFLKERAGVRHFIETGTFRGETAQWAAGYFDEVSTIELSPKYHAAAVRRFAGEPRVKPLAGASPEVLARLVPTLSSPALFWLDAHWSGLDTSGRGQECPLLEELAPINASVIAHVVLVDDARLFCAPPPAPHRVDAWPDLATTVGALAAQGRRHVVLWDDVLVAVPVGLRGGVEDFLRSPAARATKRRSWLRGLLR